MRLPGFITDILCAKVWSVMQRRKPDVQIGRDERGIPYMERWHAIKRNRFFNVYLHLYHHDDDRILHSHPWWSVSILVSGALREFYTRTSEGANRPELHKARTVRRGGIVWRSADMFHRLEVAGNRTITIFITGPKFAKSWHFACKRGLIHWKQFVSVGRGGQGCGEDDDYPKRA
ncbi:hypothetical protein JQ593_22655 [Bradyrhizobium viridifuturi]|jgi:hypothetical protein|nr:MULTISPECIES: hypothetical protein [Bacteria]KAH2210684.1 hypothetical protein KXW71_006918 [Aspergillus fumigatus]MBR1038888.1 hypothetical protein [Bradyrhizobium viridifuturi]MCA3704592.1 hypothetical protein [Methylobacterium sp.]MQH38622.1 hypothetical protein [Escherichia coli]OYU64036.1 MAG: hypothetical protein CFE30_00010 [Bradyrhizobium sp. PARBB1]PCL30554.1 hypothetical protein CPZ06_10320 [Lactobacillus acidophilus]POE73267.1 hypothetical protein CFP56_75218 [Quercus suber]DA